MMKWVMGLGLVLAGCISPVMTFGEGKTAKQAQHDTLTDMRPVELSSDGSWRGRIHDATIRVYADDEYRTQNLDWRKTFGESVAYANAVLGPTFGLRLVADYREWSYHAPGTTLANKLAALQQLDDDGDGALAVVGLTSSLGLVSATFDDLGYATLPGRHMILRGHADIEERKAFAEVFPDLSAGEREQALEARRRHKTAALLLHELGHNLGADHDVTADTLMYVMYSKAAAGFSTGARATILRTLDQRLGRDSAEAAPRAQTAAAAPAPQSPARSTPAPKVQIHITAKEVVFDGKPLTAAEQTALFDKWAAFDTGTELVLVKDKGVPSAKVIEVIDRAKASGLASFTLR